MSEPDEFDDDGYDPREHSAKCDACPLRGMAVVPPEGPETATVVFVGDAPFMQDVFARRPFMGPAGAKLAEMLSKVGLKRSDVFLTNALLCRPEVPGETGARRYDLKLYLAWLRKTNIARKRANAAALAKWRASVAEANREIARVSGQKLRKVDLYVPPVGFPPFVPPEPLFESPLSCCYPRLRGELHRAERASSMQVNGAVVVPMGNFATSAVQGEPDKSVSLQKWRGSVLPVDVQDV